MSQRRSSRPTPPPPPPWNKGGPRPQSSTSSGPRLRLVHRAPKRCAHTPRCPLAGLSTGVGITSTARRESTSVSPKTTISRSESSPRQQRALGRAQMGAFELHRVREEEDLDSIRKLFLAYTTWLGLNLDFQDYATEASTLPGKYRPPRGEIFLAKSTSTDEALGCIALRPLGEDGVCEVKRLYVTEAGRGTGVGRALVTAVVKEAEDKGYKEAKLDTLPHMLGAIKLYESAGFARSEKYYETPLEDTVFFSKKL